MNMAAKIIKTTSTPKVIKFPQPKSLKIVALPKAPKLALQTIANNPADPKSQAKAKALLSFLPGSKSGGAANLKAPAQPKLSGVGVPGMGSVETGSATQPIEPPGMGKA